MQSLENKIVANIVIDNINTAKIFKKHKIDFGVGGNIPLSKACQNKSINLHIITNELISVDKNVFYLKNYKAWKLDFLIDFLICIHHENKETAILLLRDYSEKVCRLYSDKFLELIEINTLLQNITDEILIHMKNEEEILFPYIKKLIALEKQHTRQKIVNSPFDSPIEEFEDEHYKISFVFKRISMLTNNYKIPNGVCNYFKILYTKLQQFEEELEQHIHLENNILFPKAKNLERKVRIPEEEII